MQQPPRGSCDPARRPAHLLAPGVTWCSRRSSLRASPFAASTPSSSSSSSHENRVRALYDYNYKHAKAIAAKAAPPHSGRTFGRVAWTTSSSRSASSASSGVGGGSRRGREARDEGRSERRLTIRHGHRHLLAHVTFAALLEPPGPSWTTHSSAPSSMLRTNGRQKQQQQQQQQQHDQRWARAYCHGLTLASDRRGAWLHEMGRRSCGAARMTKVRGSIVACRLYLLRFWVRGARAAAEMGRVAREKHLIAGRHLDLIARCAARAQRTGSSTPWHRRTTLACTRRSRRSDR